MVDDAGLLELVVEIVALAGALADSGKDREAAVLLGDVVDQLLDDDRLAHAGAAEEADLAALQEWPDQVDDLDAGLEHLFAGGLLVEGGGGAVDRHGLVGVDRTKLVDRLADHVEDAAQRRAAHRHGDGAAGIDGLHAADHALGRLHGDGADAAFAEVLLHLEDDVDRRWERRSRRW